MADATNRIWINPTDRQLRWTDYAFDGGTPFIPEDVAKAELAKAVAETWEKARNALYSPSAGTMASGEFHSGFEQMRRLAIDAISRAARDEEGE